MHRRCENLTPEQRRYFKFRDYFANALHVHQVGDAYAKLTPEKFVERCVKIAELATEADELREPKEKP